MIYKHVYTSLLQEIMFRCARLFPVQVVYIYNSLYPIVICHLNITLYIHLRIELNSWNDWTDTGRGVEFDRQFRPTNRKTEMLMRPTSIMRYFHLATIALTLWKLHVQDLLGSKLTTSSVYTLLRHPQECLLSFLFFLSPLSLSFFFFCFSLSLTISLSRTFFSHYVLLFLPFVMSVSLSCSLFAHSPSLSSSTPDDSSYYRTTPQPPLHPLARYGVV